MEPDCFSVPTRFYWLQQPGWQTLVLADERLKLLFAVLSTCYLLYLAAKIAFAGSKIAFIEAQRPPGIWGGIALQIINPKAYAVGLFVFSNFPFWPDSPVGEIVAKFIILNANLDSDPYSLARGGCHAEPAFTSPQHPTLDQSGHGSRDVAGCGYRNLVNPLWQLATRFKADKESRLRASTIRFFFPRPLHPNSHPGR